MAVLLMERKARCSTEQKSERTACSQRLPQPEYRACREGRRRLRTEEQVAESLVCKPGWGRVRFVLRTRQVLIGGLAEDRNRVRTRL